MSRPKAADRLASLERALAGRRHCLILAHDNPDPDALASAFALAWLLTEGFGLEATVAFSGVIGRAENRAMLKVLELAPVPLSTLDLGDFDAIALVDTQPDSGNNSTPEGHEVAVVIDHHPAKAGGGSIAFRDVRPSYGSTATILLEYLRARGLDIPVPIATALFYALKSETQDLGREASEPDRKAYFQLLVRADMRAVARIQRARVPREYFGFFRTAIDRAEVRGPVVVSDLGVVPSPDIVSEIADFLLRLQGIGWSCCFGRHENTLLVSLRTSDPEAHAGSLIRAAVAGLGTAGGHGSMAGAQIPISERSVDETLATLRVRILEALGASDAAAEPLVR